MPSIPIIAFTWCYAIAFGLELFSLKRRPTWFPTPLVIATIVGLVIQGFYLYRSAIGANALPISTADWLLLVAWVLAIVYLATLFYLPRTPTGLVLLPIVLGLILGSRFASSAPLATGESYTRL